MWSLRFIFVEFRFAFFIPLCLHSLNWSLLFIFVAFRFAFFIQERARGGRWCLPVSPRTSVLAFFVGVGVGNRVVEAFCDGRVESTSEEQ